MNTSPILSQKDMLIIDEERIFKEKNINTIIVKDTDKTIIGLVPFKKLFEK